MRRITSVLLIGALIGIGGCAATQQAKSVEKSGFMDQKTYSMLKEGKKVSPMFEDVEDQVALVYVNPDFLAGKYKFTKIKLDPVTVFVGKDSPLSKVEPKDREMMADLLWNRLHDELGKDYAMVNQLGPETIWYQLAITEGEESNVVLDSISSVIPQARMLSGMKSLATGVSAFTGVAAAEFKFTDGETGTLLAAAVDRRGGTKSLYGVTNSWNDVDQAYRFWAEKSRYRLCQVRKGTNCVPPKP